jgi:hypothetical protein
MEIKLYTPEQEMGQRNKKETKIIFSNVISNNI